MAQLHMVAAGTLSLPVIALVTAGALLAVCFAPFPTSEAMERRSFKGSSHNTAHSPRPGAKSREVTSEVGYGYFPDQRRFDRCRVEAHSGKALDPPSSHNSVMRRPRQKRVSNAVVPRRSLWAHSNGCSDTATVCITLKASKRDQRRTTCCGDSCVDLATNPNHCGHCGHVCKWDRSCCKGKCRNLNDDTQNCGKCGMACRDGTCRFGLCAY